MDMISSIKYMQNLGLSQSNNTYDEHLLSNMSLDELTKIHSEVMGNTSGSGEPEMDEATAPSDIPPKPTKPKTVTKKENDPFWNDMDNMFNPTNPDQPLTVPDDDGEFNDTLPDPEEPSRTLPAASAETTRNRLAGMTPTDAMRQAMNAINRNAITPDTEEPVIPVPQNELVVRTARDVPAVISTAMQAAGVQSPEWHHVRNLPGMTDAHIRSMGRSVFSMFTTTPAGDIQTIANVNGQGPNTDEEMRAVAGWLRDNAEDMGIAEVGFGMAIPGYRPEVKEYRANGIRFHVVRDPHGQYIYAYPENTARIQGPGAQAPGRALGGRNTPRLRENIKGNIMSLSLFEELDLDESIRDTLKKLIKEEEAQAASQKLTESTLSKEIGWKPGPSGKQEKNQGGQNLLRYLHTHCSFSNDVPLQRLPINRDALYGYFKNDPDHFIVVKGTHGVAAIRPTAESLKNLTAQRRKNSEFGPGWSPDPNVELRDPHQLYNIFAYQMDGKQLNPDLFKQHEKEDKPSKKKKPTFDLDAALDGGGPAAPAAPADAEPEYQMNFNKQNKARMGKFHQDDTEPDNIFRLLSEQIGKLTAMWMTGFYALRKQQIGDKPWAEPEIKRHTGSSDAQKLKHRKASPGERSTPRIPGGFAKSDAEKAARLTPATRPEWGKADNVKLPSKDYTRHDSPVLDYNPKTGEWEKSDDKPMSNFADYKPRKPKHDLTGFDVPEIDEASAAGRRKRLERDKIRFNRPVPNADDAGNVRINPGEYSAAYTKLFNKIKPLFSKILQKANSHLYLEFNKANNDGNDKDLDRILILKKRVTALISELNTATPNPLLGEIYRTMDKVLSTVTGFSLYGTPDKFKQSVIDLSKGSYRDYLDLIEVLKRTLIGEA
jgi:hypothetical protein